MNLDEILDLIDVVDDLVDECQILPTEWAIEMRKRAIAIFEQRGDDDADD